jgi:hypothetical protein
MNTQVPIHNAPINASTHHFMANLDPQEIARLAAKHGCLTRSRDQEKLDALDAKRLKRRDTMRKYRDRRHAIGGIHRVDYPDGLEGTKLYFKAYNTAYRDLHGRKVNVRREDYANKAAWHAAYQKAWKKMRKEATMSEDTLSDKEMLQRIGEERSAAIRRALAVERQVESLRNYNVILRRQIGYMEKILTLIWTFGCEPECANVQSALNPIWKAGLSEE